MKNKYKTGMVRVYWNLHKNCYSYAVYENGKFGRVKHVNCVTLKSAFQVVSEVGRQRVLKEKRKNVHAYIVGYKTRKRLEHCKGTIFYNPYECLHFITEDYAKWEGGLISLTINDDKPVLQI